MEQQNQNKEFVIRYFNAISGVIKSQELLEKYITDEELIGHIAYFDAAFPKYEMFADEMTSEGNRIVVRARWKGRHEGELNNIPPTYREVEMPFVISYQIDNDKIVHHWIIIDQMAFMEKLGLMSVPS